MWMFWLAALVLMLIALALTLPAFWGYYRRPELDRTAENIALAKTRLQELKQQLADSVLSDEQYQQQKNEVEQSLAYDLANSEASAQVVPAEKKMIHLLALVFFVPVVSFGLYLSLGSPELLFKQTPVAQQQQQQAQAPHSLEEMLQSLEAKLQANPDNVKGWMMLGRSYMTLDRFEDAAKIYKQVAEQFGENAGVLLAEADARAMMNKGRMQGRPAELVKKALALSPNNTTGLWLAGIAEKEQGNIEQAINYWEKAEQNLAAEPQSREKLRQMITAAEQELGKSPSEFVARMIRVRVSIAPDMLANAAPDDTVFILARPTEGRRMPLAIVKKRVDELPVEVTLTDAQAMMPSMSISKFETVEVTAKVSKSGQAMTQSGDIVADSVKVSTRSEQIVDLTIKQLIQ